MARYRKVVVIGLDGLDPVRVERMLGAGQLPHLDALRRRGGSDRVTTTTPAQTPVAWSTLEPAVLAGHCELSLNVTFAAAAIGAAVARQSAALARNARRDRECIRISSWVGETGLLG
jgi:hypothetical protein